MRQILSVAAAVGICLFIAGCVTPLVNYAEMTPEQIRELVRDKSVAATCLTANTPYGKGITTHMAIDKAVIAAGGSLTINDQCMVIFTNGANAGAGIPASVEPLRLRMVPLP